MINPMTNPPGGIAWQQTLTLNECLDRCGQWFQQTKFLCTGAIFAANLTYMANMNGNCYLVGGNRTVWDPAGKGGGADAGGLFVAATPITECTNGNGKIEVCHWS
jgi:hypothetical protein